MVCIQSCSAQSCCEPQIGWIIGQCSKALWFWSTLMDWFDQISLMISVYIILSRDHSSWTSVFVRSRVRVRRTLMAMLYLMSVVLMFALNIHINIEKNFQRSILKRTRQHCSLCLQCWQYLCTSKAMWVTAGLLFIHFVVRAVVEESCGRGIGCWFYFILCRESVFSQ